MSTKEIADKALQWFKANEAHRLGQTYWSDDVVSYEAMTPPGMDRVARGRAAVEAKGRWFQAHNEVKVLDVDGPYVNGEVFALRNTCDITEKATGNVHHVTELCLYTLKDDRIVEERFLY